MSIFFVGYPSIAPPRPTPALFTSTSIRPQRSRCSSTARTTSSSSVICAATACTSIPSERRSAAAASSLSGRRAATVTPYPSSPSARAIAKPMPLEPPVTSAARSATSAPLVAITPRGARGRRTLSTRAQSSRLGSRLGALSTIACRAFDPPDHLSVPSIGTRPHPRRMRRRRRALHLGRATHRSTVRRRLSRARRWVDRPAHRQTWGRRTRSSPPPPGPSSFRARRASPSASLTSRAPRSTTRTWPSTSRT